MGRSAAAFASIASEGEKPKKKWLKPKFVDNLGSLVTLLESVDTWEVETLETTVKAWMEENELAFKHWAPAARVSLSGRAATPGMFDVMAVLGRDISLARLRAGAKIAAEAGETA